MTTAAVLKEEKMLKDLQKENYDKGFHILY